MTHIDGLQPFRRGQKLKAEELNAIMRAAKALEAAMPGFNEGDTRAFSMHKSSPSLRWVKWKNVDSQTCPAYGVIQPTSTLGILCYPLKGRLRTYEGKRPYYEPTQRTFQPPWYLVNSSVPVAAGRYGWATYLFEPGFVLASEPPNFEVNSPLRITYSQNCYGVEADSWELVNRKDGQFVLLGALEEEQNVIIAYQLPRIDAFTHTKSTHGTVQDSEVYTQGFDYFINALNFNNYSSNDGTVTTMMGGTFLVVASGILRAQEGYTTNGGISDGTDLILSLFRDDDDTGIKLFHTVQKVRNANNTGPVEVICHTSTSGILGLLADQVLSWKNTSGYPIDVEDFCCSITHISSYHHDNLY